MAIVPVVLVHGGAGDVPEASRAAHAEGCRVAAARGLARLLETGSALEAAMRAVEVLEDDPRYNAGTGACLDERGELALDAAIMEGTSLRAGAVCAMPAFVHPIQVARAVLEDGRHVLYAGEGAARFAEERGFARAEPASMITRGGARAPRERARRARRARLGRRHRRRRCVRCAWSRGGGDEHGRHGGQARWPRG